MEHITRSIVLPDDTINRRKAKGTRNLRRQKDSGRRALFNKDLKTTDMMPGKQETEKGVPAYQDYFHQYCN